MLRNKKLISFSLSLLSVITFSAYAVPSNTHVVIAPQCLLKNDSPDFKILSSTPEFSLIATNDAGINKLIEAKDQQRATACGGFMDVTENWNAYKAKHLVKPNKAKQFLIDETKSVSVETAATKAKYDIKYEKQVTQLLNQLNPDDMWNKLTTLSSFQDRYANSAHGVKAAEWIKTYMENLAKENNRSDVTAHTVSTGTYKQPSVVVKVGEGSGPGIVIGAHMDTLLGSDRSPRPGADDDGSGTVTVLEIARTVLSSGMTFNKPIYFIWYAAEEQGLVGSGYVVSEFKKKKIPVDAVLHFDMTGYENDSTMWLMKDNSNKELTAYLEKLINSYVKRTVKYTACGYACSDHASWTKGGFAAAMPFESSMNNDNPYIHSANDTINNLSKEHMTDYAKLGVAFAVELAEPKV